MAEVKREHRQACLDMCIKMVSPEEVDPELLADAQTWIETGVFDGDEEDKKTAACLSEAIAEAEQRGYTRGLADGAERERTEYTELLSAVSAMVSGNKEAGVSREEHERALMDRLVVARDKFPHPSGTVESGKHLAGESE